MPTRSPPTAAAALIARSHASGEGTVRRRDPPSAMFVRHSPGAATRSTAPTTVAGRDDEPQIEPARSDQLLDERPMTAEPPPVAEVPEARAQLGARLATADVAAPAPEPGLDHVRRLESGRALVAGDVYRARLGDRRSIQEYRGRELVVRRDQHVCPVDDLDAPLANLEQAAEARLNTVERRPDVEPADDHVAGARLLSGKVRGAHRVGVPVASSAAASSSLVAENGEPTRYAVGPMLLRRATSIEVTAPPGPVWFGRGKHRSWSQRGQQEVSFRLPARPNMRALVRHVCEAATARPTG